MTRARFIHLSGWGMVVAALCLLLTFLPDQSFSTSVVVNPFFFAILLITLGILGLGARYGAQAWNTATIALGAGVLGGVAGLASNILWTIGHENGRLLMNFSMAVMFGGLVVFGLVALREKTMRRGNGLPVLAGLWWPSILISGYLYHQLTGLWLNVTFWPSFALFLGMSFSLALLGYVLQSDASPERSAA